MLPVFFIFDQIWLFNRALRIRIQIFHSILLLFRPLLMLSWGWMSMQWNDNNFGQLCQCAKYAILFLSQLLNLQIFFQAFKRATARVRMVRQRFLTRTQTGRTSTKSPHGRKTLQMQHVRPEIHGFKVCTIYPNCYSKLEPLKGNKREKFIYILQLEKY